jgi:hypothetical protein
MLSSLLQFSHTQSQLDDLLVFAAQQNRERLFRAALQAGGDFRRNDYYALLVAERLENNAVVKIMLDDLNLPDDRKRFGEKRDREHILTMLDPLHCYKPMAKRAPAVRDKELNVA